MAVLPQASRPSARATVGLMAGRGMFRLGQWVSAVLLVGAWGQPRFAVYAVAIASSQWLVAVASAGVEKTMIALSPLPESEGVGRRLIGWAWLGLIGVTVLATVLMIFERAVRPWPAAMVYGAAVGATLVAVAALRLTGRMWPDQLALSAIGLSHVAATGLAIAGDWSAAGVLIMLASVALLVAFIALLAAWRLHRGAARSGPKARDLLREMSFTGASEICNMVAAAVVYAILASTDHAAEAAELYIGSMVGQIAIGATVYLMRLAGGAVSAAASADGRNAALQTVRRFRTCLIVTALALAVVTGLLAAPLSDRAIVLVTLLAVPPTLLVLRASAWAEFGTAAGRRAAATGAVAGLLAAIGLSSVLVRTAGAGGGIIGLLVGIGVQSVVAASLIRRAGRSPGTAAVVRRRNAV